MVITFSNKGPLLQRVAPNELDDRLDLRFYDLEYTKVMKELKSGNFELINLKDICTKLHRGTAPQYAEKGFQVLKTVNIKNDTIDWSTSSYVSEDFFIKNQRSQLKKGDILLASTGVGSLGKVDIFNSNEKCTVDGHITIIRCDKKMMDPCFVLYYLRSNYGQVQIEHYIRGTTGQIELYAKDIGLIKIPKLPVKIQKRVINIMNNAYKKKKLKLLESEKLKTEAFKSTEVAEKKVKKIIIDTHSTNS